MKSKHTLFLFHFVIVHRIKNKNIRGFPFKRGGVDKVLEVQICFLR